MKKVIILHPDGWDEEALMRYTKEEKISIMWCLYEQCVYRRLKEDLLFNSIALVLAINTNAKRFEFESSFHDRCNERDIVFISLNDSSQLIDIIHKCMIENHIVKESIEPSDYPSDVLPFLFV